MKFIGLRDERQPRMNMHRARRRVHVVAVDLRAGMIARILKINGTAVFPFEMDQELRQESNAK